MRIQILTILPLLLVLVTITCPQVSAYSTPLNWDPMSMPIISYDPTTNKLAVQTKIAAPLGTNTTSIGKGTAPGIASFDPTQVWSTLNGVAFSRNLGWDDSNGGDPVNSVPSKINSVYGFEVDGITPRGHVWIESISQSPGLSSYLAVGFFGVNANGNQTVDPTLNPPPYSGIFGTGSSPTRWKWDGLMDHNAYSVPFSYLTAPNQIFSAYYKIYIGDANGTELLTGTPATSAATTTTWNWQGPAFVFSSQPNAAVNTLVESDVYTVSGAAAGAQPVSITGGEYAVSTNGGTIWASWTVTAGTIANTNKVKVRQTSAAGHGVITVATLAIPAIPGPGEFRVTTTIALNLAWPVKNVGGYDQPSLAYAYSLAPDMVEPNNAEILIKNVTLAETSFTADRNITVTLTGGCDANFTPAVGVTILPGPFYIRQGKVIVDRLTIR